MTRRAAGEGTIRWDEKRKRWEARLSLGFGADGQRVRKAVYGKTQAAVRQKLDVLKAQVSSGLPVATERITVKTFLEQWLADAESAGKWAPLTLRRHRDLVRVHLVPALGRHRLEKLEPDHVQRLMAAKLDAGLSPRTVKYIRGLLRQALEQALRWGKVTRNVAALTETPKKVDHEFTAWTADEAKRFLAAVAGDRLQPLYAVGVACGLRQGELLGLKWSDVDLRAGTLTIKNTLQRIDGAYQLRPPKTEKSRRTIVLPAVARRALRQHRSAQLEERLRAGDRWDQDWDLVFSTATGAPIHGPWLTKLFQRTLHAHRLCQCDEEAARSRGREGRCQPTQMRFHDLRHSCASLLWAQGVDLKGIQETLGHSSIETTSNIYTHMQDEGRQEVASRMDAALGG